MVFGYCRCYSSNTGKFRVEHCYNKNNDPHHFRFTCRSLFVLLLLKGCRFQEGCNCLVHTANTITACGLIYPNKRKMFVIEGKKEQINLVEKKLCHTKWSNICRVCNNGHLKPISDHLFFISVNVHFDVASYECCCFRDFPATTAFQLLLLSSVRLLQGCYLQNLIVIWPTLGRQIPVRLTRLPCLGIVHFK